MWFYSYDPTTKSYSGMVFSEESEIDNATKIPIGNIINPIWDNASQQWRGDDIQDVLNDIKGDTPNQIDLTNQKFSVLTKTVADLNDSTSKSLATLMLTISDQQKTVKELQEKLSALAQEETK